MISIDKEEKEIYLKSVIYGWFSSTDKGNHVFVIKTSRGFESWDYSKWSKVVKLNTKIDLPIEPNISEIEIILLPIIRELKLEELLKV
jgi:hypothetical protein